MKESTGTNGNTVEGICDGCDKINDHGNCTAYATPSIWKRGCPLNSSGFGNLDKARKVRMGQQKQKFQDRSYSGKNDRRRKYQ